MRLIDADSLFKEMEKRGWHDNADRDDIAEELLLNAPTVFAVPVVRCGQCKFRSDFTDGHCECRRWPNVPMSYQSVDPNFDFCSYGERKDG